MHRYSQQIGKRQALDYLTLTQIARIPHMPPESAKDFTDTLWRLVPHDEPEPELDKEGLDALKRRVQKESKTIGVG